MKQKDSFYYLDKITNAFEIAIAYFLLVIIVVKAIEIVIQLFGLSTVLLPMEFNRIMSLSFTLVIGVEFTKMLYRHTPETVIDVLLFALARQMIVYSDRTIDVLIGVVAISPLFAAKKFLIGTSQSGSDEKK